MVEINCIDQLFSEAEDSESKDEGEVEEDACDQEGTNDSTDIICPPSGMVLKKLVSFIHKHKEYSELQCDLVHQYSPEVRFRHRAGQRSVSHHPTVMHSMYCKLTNSQRESAV